MQIRKKGDEIFKKSSPLKLLSQSQPNFAEMILGWSPFKIVSVSAVLYPRWPPLLKIEISSNGQNCSILSQKVPKFELYKHNDELFNIYYGIFYELWTFAYFDRLCKLEKRGNEKFETTEPISTKLCWNDLCVVPFQICVRQRRPVSKITAMTKNENGQNCSILSQKVPKFELYKHNELFNIYYVIFYELWSFAYFVRLCKLEKRGDEIKKKIFSSETTEPIFAEMILGWSSSKIVSGISEHRPRWPPQPNLI